jgi:gas vesicle protein
MRKRADSVGNLNGGLSMSQKDFLLGAMAGAIAGILFAPKSGKNTRESMRTYYFEMKDNILENLSQIKDISKETYENVVNSVVKGYEEAKVVTSEEAAQIKHELKSGYTRIKTVLAASEEK